MSTFFGWTVIAIIFFVMGMTFDLGAVAYASTLQTGSGSTSASTLSVWPIFTTVAFSGALGGLVHALESDSTHQIQVPFNGKLADTGAWGHIFIGFCGAFVAVAIMMAIFGFNIGHALGIKADFAEGLKYFFYLAAVGIIGGYSGLPIIALVSNAALKKVQQEVDQLKISEKVTKETMGKMKLKLREKDEQLISVSLQSILLTAQSLANMGSYNEAILKIEKEYLPSKDDDSKAYHWLAYCEKRLGNVTKAIEHVTMSIQLKPSRLGYYNLACYMNILDYPKDEVIRTIQNAWKFSDTKLDQEKVLSGLQDDEDFVSLAEQSDFKALITQYKLKLGS
ncbi:hypothetical protein L2729_17345 [Shewanella gelidimarina]|uniref:hypothetical protein n=1 Tax=Shewanella gelidimarina TaxID=56813 RepID=UPI00200CBEFE|nr:hypothetical protein [Shewanella gelidimarina]MCL1059739.1 hypothetical protein [Shewanella gelidimarina]